MANLICVQTRVDFLPGDGETCQYGPYKLSTRLVATHEGYQEMLVNCTKPKRLNVSACLKDFFSNVDNFELIVFCLIAETYKDKITQSDFVEFDLTHADG